MGETKNTGTYSTPECDWIPHDYIWNPNAVLGSNNMFNPL